MVSEKNITFTKRDNNYTKEDYEKAIVAKLSQYNIDLICLAGYMRIIGVELLSKYEGIIINTHPSLLPSFRGKDAIEQAMDYLISEARASLNRTPELLPVLKDVGVVDSGGAGLLYILEGFQLGLTNRFVERKGKRKDITI